MAQVKKGQGKQKVKQSQENGNRFDVIQDIDGNPQSPADFDKEPHGDDELYFQPAENASEADKQRCLILNYIHQRLRPETDRVVPSYVAGQDDKIEVYHREEFRGVSLDVCVYFPTPPEGHLKECVALVKYTSANLEDEGLEGTVHAGAIWSADAQKDRQSLIVDKLTRNYWVPRWKYVVKYLDDRMWEDFDKFGNEVKYEVESEIPRGTDITYGATKNGSLEEVEDIMMVFSGATGKIIGPKGSKIHEIKDATHVVEIQMPPKNEDGSRPRARELVGVTLKGTQDNINKAKAMIQDVVDEWANAPRPPRDGGGGGGGGYGITDYTANGGDYTPQDSGTSVPVVDGADDWEASTNNGTSGAGGGGESWEQGGGADRGKPSWGESTGGGGNW
ncbi:hypothetical protein EG329_012045 [Mollisiaceae sp. DMI_Dod_QoI]|nr:hypothetical protein EG329_012045 [Helotiales sp. DMI_Dod_QoI]